MTKIHQLKLKKKALIAKNKIKLPFDEINILYVIKKLVTFFVL